MSCKQKEKISELLPWPVLPSTTMCSARFRCGRKYLCLLARPSITNCPRTRPPVSLRRKIRTKRFQVLAMSCSVNFIDFYGHEQNAIEGCGDGTRGTLVLVMFLGLWERAY